MEQAPRVVCGYQEFSRLEGLVSQAEFKFNHLPPVLPTILPTVGVGTGGFWWVLVGDAGRRF